MTFGSARGSNRLESVRRLHLVGRPTPPFDEIAFLAQAIFHDEEPFRRTSSCGRKLTADSRTRLRLWTSPTHGRAPCSEPCERTRCFKPCIARGSTWSAQETLGRAPAWSFTQITDPGPTGRRVDS